MESPRSTVFLKGVLRGLAKRGEGLAVRRPTLVKADGSLVIGIDSDRCVVIPDFFRTGGELRWEEAQGCLIWRPGEVPEEQVIALPAAPDLSAIGLGGPRKSRAKAWALGIAVFLILPALWVRLLAPAPPPGLLSPSRFAPGFPPPPGSVQRFSGTGWMK